MCRQEPRLNDHSTRPIGPPPQSFARRNEALGIARPFGIAGATLHNAQGQRRHSSVDPGQLREAFAAQHIGQVSRAYRLNPYHYAVYGPGGISQGLLGQWLGLKQPQYVECLGVSFPDQTSPLATSTTRT